MAALSEDVLLEIANYLDTQDLFSTAAVCKAWHQYLFSHPQVWQQPHFLLKTSRTRLARHGYLCKPAPQSLSLLLKGLPAHGLHLTGTSDRTIMGVGYHLDSLMGLILGNDTLDRRADFSLHLILEDMHTTEECISAAQKFRNVGHLSLIFRTDLNTLVATLGWLRRSMVKNDAPGTVQIYFKSHVNTAQLCRGHDLLPVLRCPLEDSGSKGLHTLTCHIPVEKATSWYNPSPQALLPCDSLKRVSVEGGFWKIEATAKNQEALKHLECRHLRVLECRRSSMRFDALVSVHLSLDSEGPTKWGDVRHFMETVMGESLEVLELHFPSGFRDTQDRGLINDGWGRALQHTINLRQVTLVNYIPSTLSRLIDNQDVASKLEKLVLAGHALPRDFAKTILPDSLPALRILDNSDTSFHRFTPSRDQQNWVKAWQRGNLTVFKPAEALGGRFDDVN